MPHDLEDDDTHPEETRFWRLLASVEFPDRYYAYCRAHEKSGPDIPLVTQKKALAATGRVFRYHKGESFFAWRDTHDPPVREVGLNVSLADGRVEWILVFKTPAGHLGCTFAGMAANAKRLTQPAYRHTPPYPTPDVSNKAELTAVLEEGLALYDDLTKHLAAQDWR